MKNLFYNNYNLKNYLISNVPDLINFIYIMDNMFILATNSENLLKILTFLRDHTLCRFKLLMDITATDFPSFKNRFEVTYNLLTLTYNIRILVKSLTNENFKIPSTFQQYQSSEWLEREIWDLFGIFPQEHQDLRRILTDYGFTGFPLRKDFPLSGYNEVRYDDKFKKIVLELLTFLKNLDILIL